MRKDIFVDLTLVGIIRNVEIGVISIEVTNFLLEEFIAKTMERNHERFTFRMKIIFQ